MSFDAVQWAFSQEVLSSTQKFVLVALCDVVGDTGLSYPKMSTITRITSLHEDTVRSALAALVEAGFIEDTGKTAGSTARIKVYRLPTAAWVIPRKSGVLNPRRIPEESPKNPPEKRGIAYNNSERELSTTGEPVGEHKAFIDGWVQNFETVHKVKYQFEGKRDGRAVKELLGMGILRIDLLEIAKKAWMMPNHFLASRALTIHGFRENFNAINSGVKNGKQIGSKVGSLNPAADRRNAGTSGNGTDWGEVARRREERDRQAGLAGQSSPDAVKPPAT